MLENGKSMFTLNLDKGSADGRLNCFELCLEHVKQSVIIFRMVCRPLGT